jgi:hypothetical protein
MMELIFVVCLSSDPTACDRKAMQFSDMSMMACVVCAQPVLAQWTNEHPGWDIQRWVCQPAGSDRGV